MNKLFDDEFNPNNHSIKSITCLYCNKEFIFNKYNSQYNGAPDSFTSTCHKCNVHYLIQNDWQWTIPYDPIDPKLELIPNSEHVNMIFIPFTFNNNKYNITFRLQNMKIKLFSNSNLLEFPASNFLPLNKQQLINKLINLLPFI